MEKDILIEFLKKDRFASLNGIELVEAGEGFCKTKMEIKDHHLNAANVVHGGAIFTLADYAFAGASNSRGKLSLAINAEITYLKGKSTGTLYAIAKEVAIPKKIGAFEVEVTDEFGEIIAKFNGLVYRKDIEILPQ